MNRYRVHFSKLAGLHYDVNANTGLAAQIKALRKLRFSEEIPWPEIAFAVPGLTQCLVVEKLSSLNKNKSKPRKTASIDTSLNKKA